MSDSVSNSHKPAPERAGNTHQRAKGAPAAPFDATELLARLWRQNLPIIRHRVEVLETAASQLLADDLSLETRSSASDVAHKLAGSLGMFGYPAGTDIARALENMLDDHVPLDPPRFAELAAELRSVLPL